MGQYSSLQLFSLPDFSEGRLPLALYFSSPHGCLCEGTEAINTDMENSPKLESMPTLCRSATLPAETTISKWRVMATIRQLLQLPTGGTSAFGGLRVLEGLFSFCAVVPIFITFFGVRPNFKACTTAFIYFLLFSTFLKWILILLVREKHRKTLYRFLLRGCRSLLEIFFVGQCEVFVCLGFGHFILLVYFFPWLCRTV